MMGFRVAGLTAGLPSCGNPAVDLPLCKPMALRTISFSFLVWLSWPALKSLSFFRRLSSSARLSLSEVP